jgi:hypothetical protein
MVGAVELEMRTRVATGGGRRGVAANQFGNLGVFILYSIIKEYIYIGGIYI